MMHSIFRATGLVTAAFALLTTALPASAAPSRDVSQTAVLAGGCFWGMQDVFEKLRGVTDVEAGYAGGSAQSAHYESVSSGTTGHAESVRITFDPRAISYVTLLEVYFTVAHDPTELDRQGPDSGSQYRSAIFYEDRTQERAARAEITQLTKRKTFAVPIVTQVVPLRGFYLAETYHQHFADRNPSDFYIMANDAPKVAALQKVFPRLVKRRS